MNKTLFSVIGKCCLLSLITLQAALAFNQSGDLTVTAGAGYDYFSNKRWMENTGIPFGIIGYNLTDHWGVEGLLGFFYTTSRDLATFGKDVSGTMFALDAVYHFSPYKFAQPYFLAGPGVMGFSPNGNDANNEGNLNAAVGVELFTNEIVAFRIEARDFYTFVGGKNDILLNGGVTFFIAT